MAVRIIQLTDLHLFADMEGTLKGVPTWKSFQEVLEYLATDFSEFDLLVITGDLAHDELRQTYAQLRDVLAPSLPMVRLIPGNHDHRAFMREVFHDIIPPPVHGDPDEPVCFSLELEGWRILGIDSHVFGSVPGFIQAEQYQWLELELKGHPDAPTLLFMHHPPVSVNTPWMDRISLQNPERLLELIDQHPQVHCLFGGHVHHEFTGSAGHAGFLTTPSTSVQFTPETEELVPDLLPPGFRIIDLDDEDCATWVERLPHLNYPPLDQ